MAVPRVLCIVLAGGRGSRLGPLTTGRAKPALPVGGNYRLIDVALSNAAHSALIDVWVLEQYEPHLLNEHLSGGRPWDLDRSRGGFRTLPPFEGHHTDGFADGNADALARNWPVIAAFDPDVLLVCSADHLLTIDLRNVLATHLESSADATIVGTKLPARSDVSRFLVVRSEWRQGDIPGSTSRTSPRAVTSARRCSPTDRTRCGRACDSFVMKAASSATTANACCR